jgi:hypothetical protein
MDIKICEKGYIFLILEQNVAGEGVIRGLGMQKTG